MTDSFYTPTSDQGEYADAPFASSLPRVLILGDSISLGYMPTVVDGLAGVAEVRRPNVNCGDTRYGVQEIDVWLGATDWDIIHFNWGLHDLCYRHPESTVYGCRDKERGTLSVAMDDYHRNLTLLVERMQRQAQALVWASTTLVPEGEAGRFVGDDVRYNEAAAEVMAAHTVSVNDLYALSKTFPPDLFVCPGDVHYTAAGKTKLGNQVVAVVRGILQSGESISRESR